MANTNRRPNSGESSRKVKMPRLMTDPVNSSLTAPASLGVSRPGVNRDLTRMSPGSKISVAGIAFGSPANSRISARAGSIWSGLVRQAGSGSIAGIASGGGLNLLGGLSGAGGLLSSLASLFRDTKSTPAPLVAFQLPQPEQHTVYVGTNVTPGNHAVFAQPLNPQPTVGGGQLASSQYQSSQVVQAVKQALLNSSALNDVIAEI